MTAGFIPQIVLTVVAVVLAITRHEAAHGYAALALGDTTARDQGRLTLNPLKQYRPHGHDYSARNFADHPVAGRYTAWCSCRVGQAGAGVGLAIRN